MEYRVDRDKCNGHGQCYVFAERVYSADADGFNSARGQTVTVPADLAADARVGAMSCPERAIEILEDEGLGDPS